MEQTAHAQTSAQPTHVLAVDNMLQGIGRSNECWNVALKIKIIST